MANFSFTQLKTTQLSGTFDDSLSAVTAGFGGISATDAHLQKTLDHLASSLKRLHGHGTSLANTAGNVIAPSNAAFSFDLNDDYGVSFRDTGENEKINILATSAGVHKIVSKFSSGIDGDLAFHLEDDNDSSLIRPSLVISGAYSGSVVIPNAQGTMQEGLYFGDRTRRIGSQGKAFGLGIHSDTMVALSGSTSLRFTTDGAGETKFGYSAADDANPFNVETFASISGDSSNALIALVDEASSGRSLALADAGDNVRLEVLNGVSSSPGVKVNTVLYLNGQTNQFITGSGDNTYFQIVNENALGEATKSIWLSSSVGGVKLSAGASAYVTLDSDRVSLRRHDTEWSFFDMDAKTFEPSSDGVGDLGSSSRQWNKLYVSEFVASGDVDINDLYLSGQLYVSGASDSIFAGNVQVVGNLDVVGNINSTTITENNLEIVDKFVLIASGANAAAADGGGIQIGGTTASGALIQLLWDDTNDSLDFNIGTTTQIRLQDGVLRPETDDDVDLGASGAEFKDLYLDGVAYVDEVRADALKVADTNQSHHLEIDWSEDDTSDRVLDIKVAGADRTLTLNEGFTIGDGFVGTLTYSAASKTLTVEDDAIVNQDLTTDAIVTFQGVTGSVGFEARSGYGVTYRDSDNGEYVEIKAPASVGSSYSLKWPTAIGSSNDMLTLGASGQLQFTTPSSSATAVYAHQMSSGHATGDVLDFTDAVSGSAVGAYSGAPTVTGHTPSNFIVFVNGQRMVSGSSSDVSSGNVDYTLDTAAAGSRQIEFSFPLVAGDIIMTEKTTVS